MSFFFKSKYEKKHNLESFREKMIQQIQSEKKCSREFAVRYYDKTKHEYTHNTMRLTSSILFYYMANRFCKSIVKDAPILSKFLVTVPVTFCGFYSGWVLYDKLVAHYLNFEDTDVDHTWEIDYEEKYRVKVDENLDNWEENLALTPFERMKKEISKSLSKINVEGEKVFKRLSKDKNDFYYRYGKIRNLENIVYLTQEEIDKCKNPVELQMKIDSVKPHLLKTGDPNKNVETFLDNLEEYKLLIENTRNFRSIKDKFLGLPFMINRHQQIPTPTRGTWQFDIYEKIFGEPYDIDIGRPEVEEKINKYNYHLFLHPSVINKYDTNSEEFEMYLRHLNLESQTKREHKAKQREYFCKKILPTLNLISDKNLGYDFANFVINKEKSDEYGKYLFDEYSGQKEEKLFRLAEETKYINKNEPFVQRVNYSNIDKNSIGIRADEMTEILNNPTKYKKVRKALENKFPYYQPTNRIDKIKHYRDRTYLVNTILENELDPTAADFSINDTYDLQYANEEAQPEEEYIMAHHINKPNIPGIDMNSYPYGKTNSNIFYYDCMIDWNDYSRDFIPLQDQISPKANRYEFFVQSNRRILDSFYLRTYNSFYLWDKFDYIVPSIDYKNEELKSKVLFRNNFHKYLDSISLEDSEMEKVRFLEDKTYTDSFDISDDVTEEELDQAVFESSYYKPVLESDEYRSKIIFLKIYRSR
jgi:hypothetical protein